MGVQTDLGNFTPGADSVELRGSFNGWSGGTLLTPSPGDARVYQVTLDLTETAGSTVQYKFVVDRSGTIVWEGNVGPKGSQNRTLVVPAAAETLPVVYFNNQEAPPGVVNVTFQVDMSVQKSMGRFDASNDTVEVHGSFDNWGPGITLQASSANANVYQGDLEITGSPGAVFEYKFVLNQAGTQAWEGNVGAGGSFGNRTLTLAQGNQVLPVVFFDNLAVDPGAGVPVTFRVDMGVQRLLGVFDPGFGTVTVAGQFNNWNTTATPLTNSTAAPDVFSGTVLIKAAAGTAIPFKFVRDGSNWETGDNRTFTLESSAQALPVLYFNNQATLGSLTITQTTATEVTVSWAASSQVRLQSTTSLTGTWQDVPDSTGQETMTFPVESGGNRFFRLVAP